MFCHFKLKTENGAQATFLNPFTVCSSCKRKFVLCLFVYEETNGSYPFSNGLNGLAHLCILQTHMISAYVCIRLEIGPACVISSPEYIPILLGSRGAKAALS